MFFWKIYEFSFVFGWIYGIMDQKRKIWAIAGVIRRGKETPRSGEGSPRRSKVEREGWPDLGFVAAKLSFIALKQCFAMTKPLFTAWKCCVFVSFCFSVFPKTYLLD